MDNIIVVEDFVKSYGNFNAVNHVSFTVERGSIFAFLGPNGAGKSTTINTLCTIVDKTSGTLLIDNMDISVKKDAVRKTIGVVFQDATLDVKMTVEENLKMHCYFYGIKKELIHERITFVLSIVDLLDWRKAIVSSLSGGMKRRVELARSLLHFPKVLFLDEPTTGLDPQTRAHIWDYICKLQKERNMTIFLTTHYMEEAEISDKVAIIDKGKIIAFDTPEHLKKQYTKDRAKIISSQPESLQALLQSNDLPYKKEEQIFYIEIAVLAVLLDIIAKHRELIQSIEIKKGTLQDVFLELTGREMREGVMK
ncbi:MULTISPECIES: ATP-binding cassette domain-containing protein [Bacillaceae]|uniref:ATP-binding cassette domain-containing protein n=1 Tax=Bacillaceae TaxID=186817 RepID=UPI00047CCC2A|nr:MULTISPECIES: ATP-binding cassette domain-containing protein [Bacillaceae]UOE93605.1 ATP-binding cassette domain-containing protein [Alkalihalobacillus sp. LMS39]